MSFPSALPLGFVRCRDALPAAGELKLFSLPEELASTLSEGSVCVVDTRANALAPSPAQA